MKHVFTLLIVAFMAVCLQAQTTLEEYNYVTKGYKIQIESGLDMKKGYTFKDLFVISTNYSNVPRTATFKALYRSGQASPCAIMMIYQKEKLTPEYVCVPHFLSDDSIWKMYAEKIALFNVGTDALQTIALGLAKCTGYFSQNN